MTAQVSPELSRLIDRHKLALESFEKTSEEDAGFITASRAEDEARYEVAVQPCATEAEFIAKLKYLLEAESALWGPPEFLTEFGSVVVAVEEYLAQREASRIQ